jgi:hypothetical protein
MSANDMRMESSVRRPLSSRCPMTPGSLRALLQQLDRGPVLLAGELCRPGGLADSLSAIVRAGWTGELIVDAGATRRSFFMRDGAIVGAVTNALSERIGAVMTRMGVLDHEQLRVVVGKLGPAKRFGEIAIDEGFLSRERLFDVVRRQAEEILAGAVAVDGGAFVFVEGFDAAKIAARCHLDAREAVNLALAKLAVAEGVTLEAGSIEEPITRFNKVIAAIFGAATSAGRAAALSASLASFTADSAVDRALFSRAAADGRLDAAHVAEALTTLDIRDPRETLGRRLHEYLVYALFVVSAHLPKETERALLAEVEGPMASLTPRPPRVLPRSIPPAASVPVARVALVRQPTPPPLPIVVREEVVAPAPVAPVARKRSAATAIGIVITAALVGATAFLLTRSPIAPRPPEVPAIPLPQPIFAPLPIASPSPVVSASPPATPSTVGTVRAADSGGHRIWIDGKLVGNTPQAFEVSCGLHVIRVGSSGQPQMTEVPCGGEVEVAFR